MSKKRMLAVLGAIAAFALVVGVAPAAAHDGQSDERTYEVTITNLTTGQPFTPALAATHSRSDGFFRVGRPASFELKEIAENGNLTPLMERVENDPDFYALVVQPGAGAPAVPPIMPGETVTFEIATKRPFKFISWASMLICTNDGFTGVNKLKLPNKIGQSRTVRTKAYDAGTEKNTELFKDIVPPCGPLTGQGVQVGSGMSDPALAQGGVIRRHRGILGVVNDHPHLDPAINDWHGKVAKITIERTG